MQKGETFLNNSKKDEAHMNLEEVNPTYFSLNDTSITISIDSEEETPANNVDNNSEESDDENIDEVKPKKLKIINEKRNNKASKIIDKTLIHRPNTRKSKKEPNGTTISELDKCYNKLNDLISKYSFNEIADIIIKISNGVLDDKTNNDKKELFKKIQKAISKIKNKDSITMMCLSILSSKYFLNNNIKEKPKESEEKIEIKDKNDEKDDLKDTSESESEYVEESEISEDVNEKIENKKYGKIINGFKTMKKERYIFEKHYYNDKKNIYCYCSKSTKPHRYVTAYCYHRFLGCRAKCLIFANCDNVVLSGTHSKNCFLSQKEFYENFPELKNKKWRHIQMIKKKNKPYILIVQK